MVDINIPWKPNWKPKGFDIFDIFDLVLHPEGPGTPGTGMVPSVQKKNMIAHMVNLMTGRVTHKSDTLKMFQWNHFQKEFRVTKIPRKQLDFCKAVTRCDFCKACDGQQWFLKARPCSVQAGWLEQPSWPAPSAPWIGDVLSERFDRSKMGASKAGRWFFALPLWKMMEWVTVGIMTFPIYRKT